MKAGFTRSPRHRGALRLRSDLEDPLHQAGAAPRNLQQLPPVLHGPPEADRHRGPRRAVHQALRRADCRDPQDGGESEEGHRRRRRDENKEIRQKSWRRSARKELSVFFLQLPVQPGEAMADVIRAGIVCLLQREDRQLARGHEVVLAVLVMDRQRFGREPPERREIAPAAHLPRFGQCHDLAPDGRGVLVARLAAQSQPQVVQRFSP